MKTKILIFAAVVLLLGIAIPSCLERGDSTIVLEGGAARNDEPAPEPEPEPNPNPEPNPEPEPNPNPEETTINGGHYFQIGNAVFHEGVIPSGTCGGALEVYMNNMVLAGGTNIATIYSGTQYDKFYVGINGVDGYYEYVPETIHQEDDWYVYSIPLEYSMDYQSDIEIQISASKGDCVSSVFTQEIKFVKSQEGALNVILTFDNAKDIDLHVVTPSGIEIYYGYTGGSFLMEDGEIAFMGLDHDSNAGCSIDGLNNENVVISEAFVEAGIYEVYVDLFDNCNPSIATNWTCTVRYKGELVKPNTGTNPAAGVFPVDASPFYDDEHNNLVMTFCVATSKSGIDISNVTFMPNRPSEASLQKIARKR